MTHLHPTTFRQPLVGSTQCYARLQKSAALTPFPAFSDRIGATGSFLNWDRVVGSAK